MKKVDVIVPLQDGGSGHQDMELRYLLRSLCANATGVGRVFIVTNPRPEWLVEDCEAVAWVQCEDIYRHNKDGNIFRKILAGLSLVQTEEAIWTCDDCALLKPRDMASLPVTHSMEGAKVRLWAIKSQWHNRMRRTFGYVHSRTGRWLEHFYDSHLPQRLDRGAAIAAIEDCFHLWSIDGAGVNINTAIVPFAMPKDFAGRETVPWGQLKETYERPGTVRTLGDKEWVSWNDNGWFGGVRELLEKRFPAPCRYERA